MGQILGKLFLWVLFAVGVVLMVTMVTREDERTRHRCNVAFGAAKTAHDSLTYLISNTECARFMR